MGSTLLEDVTEAKRSEKSSFGSNSLALVNDGSRGVTK
jgi:hypothetical protein